MFKSLCGTGTSIKHVVLKKTSGASLLFLMLFFVPLMALDITICRDPNRPQSVFAAQEIKSAAIELGGTVTEALLTAHNATGVTGVRVILAQTGDSISGWSPLPAPTGEQAYSIRVKNSGSLQDILIVGADVVATMYGGLDIAEAVSMNSLSSLAASSNHAPRVAKRGIKFNIPLDARSPSYSDGGDAAQANIAQVWDINFWQEYFDEMARQRLTTLSLWNLHPFPSMVTVPEYPAVALSDVKRTLVPFENVDLFGQGTWKESEMGGANLELVKTITPSQKTNFWNQVLQYAEDRGVSVYIFTWNIFTDGLEGNPYGIVEDTAGSSVKQASVVTKNYFRASVRALLTQLPKLAGLGVTSGERMDGSTSDKAKWIADTYGEGMNDVVVGYTAITPSGDKVVVPPNPTRRLNIIHRLHQITYADITTHYGRFGSNFQVDTSHKYSAAHTYCSSKPNLRLDDIAEAPPKDQVWLTARFDSQYTARWGDPDFVRDWSKNLPVGTTSEGKPKLKGFYMGPDGYTWGRRANAKDSSNNQLDIKRWWYTQYLFSRLSYDPTITNAYFDKLVAARLKISVPTADSLNRGLAFASQITPLMLRYNFSGGNDYRFFPEGCLNEDGFIPVTTFMENDPIGNEDGNGQSPLTMTAFCTAELKGLNPLDTGKKIEDAANAAEAAIASITRTTVDSELNQTLDDIKISIAMGRYYVDKFRGARELKYVTVDSANAAQHRTNAINYLTSALAKWTTYANLTDQRYHPARYNRVGVLDLKAFTPYVANDIAIAKQLTTNGPTVATHPKLNSQSGNTASLTVRGASTSDAESQLKYFWYLDGTRPAPVVYSNNGNNAARDVTVTFSKSGRYLFKVNILDSNNRYIGTKDVEVRYVASTTNQLPTVNAGTDKSVSLTAAVNLTGTVSDDGLPSATVTSTWSKISGPGTVTFANINSPTSSATFSMAGPYVLRLTATDGVLSANDEVLVNVTAAAVNAAPTVSAGPDRSVILSGSAALDGTVSDDGLPTPSTLTQLWTKVSGPGNVTFASAASVDTTAMFSLTGTYVLRLTATDGELPNQDEMTVIVSDTSSSDPIPAKPSAPSTTGDGTATPTISGTTSPGATVHVFVDGTEVGTTTAGPDGSWSYKLTGLSAGSHSITVTAQNTSGTSSPSDAITVNVAASSTTPPANDNGSSKKCGLGGLSASLLLALFAFMKFIHWLRPQANVRAIQGSSMNK
jgi:Bacterial Ig-like domain